MFFNVRNNTILLIIASKGKKCLSGLDFGKVIFIKLGKLDFGIFGKLDFCKLDFIKLVFG